MVKKSALAAVENKIPDVSGLATTSTLTAVENKIPDVSSSFKKRDFNSKITEMEGKIPSTSGLQSVTKIMGKTAIRAISCFSPLPPLNNVEKQ